MQSIDSSRAQIKAKHKDSKTFGYLQENLNVSIHLLLEEPYLQIMSLMRVARERAKRDRTNTSAKHVKRGSRQERDCFYKSAF